MDTVGHGGQQVAEMGTDLQGALSLVGETVSSKHVSAVVTAHRELPGASGEVSASCRLSDEHK